MLFYRKFESLLLYSALIQILMRTYICKRDDNSFMNSINVESRNLTMQYGTPNSPLSKDQLAALHTIPDSLDIKERLQIMNNASLYKGTYNDLSDFVKNCNSITRSNHPSQCFDVRYMTSDFLCCQISYRFMKMFDYCAPFTISYAQGLIDNPSNIYKYYCQASFLNTSLLIISLVAILGYLGF